jgi:hypothetical protein
VDEKSGEDDSFYKLALKADKICLALSVAMFVGFAIIYSFVYPK